MTNAWADVRREESPVTLSITTNFSIIKLCSRITFTSAESSWCQEAAGGGGDSGRESAPHLHPRQPPGPPQAAGGVCVAFAPLGASTFFGWENCKQYEDAWPGHIFVQEPGMECALQAPAPSPNLSSDGHSSSEPHTPGTPILDWLELTT